MSYCNFNQKVLLITLLSEDEELSSGKFSKTFTPNEARRRWIEISNKLNAIPGANKDWKHWRKTWQDIKTKAKQAQINREKHPSSGGPSTESYTASEEVVMNAMTPTIVIGHQDSTEQFADETEDENLSSQPHKIEFVDINYTHESNSNIDVPSSNVTKPSNSNTTIPPNKTNTIPSNSSNTIPSYSNTTIPSNSSTSMPSNSNTTISSYSTISGASNSRNAVPTTFRSGINHGTKRLVKGNHNQVSSVLVKLTKDKIELKERYYKAKLELLERKTIAIEKIAKCFEYQNP